MATLKQDNSVSVAKVIAEMTQLVNSVCCIAI